MSYEDQILELLESNDEKATKDWIAKHPEHASLAEDYIQIMQGFQALREAHFITTQIDEVADVEISQLFKEVKKAKEIEKLSAELSQHDQHLEGKLQPKKGNNIFSINRRILSIAASVLIIAVIGFWFFLPSEDSSSFGLIGPEYLQRSGNDQNPITAWVEEENYKALIHHFETAEDEFSLVTHYYYAYALMMEKEYEASSKFFQMVIDRDLPKYKEYAQFNIMVNNYYLGDENYKVALETYLSDPSNYLFEEARLFKKTLR